ncbi:MAG: hypothetical protein KGL39_32195 [Patescibacteria group bacterium]|nr:hypothetical protein [Patescibacteria group bacterium]
MTKKSAPTAKQKAYVQARLSGLSERDAMLKAGYSEASTHKPAQVHQHPWVKAALEAAYATRQEAVEFGVTQITDELTKIAGKEFLPSDVKVSDKLKALELLAKIHGLLALKLIGDPKNPLVMEHKDFSFEELEAGRERAQRLI